MTHFRGQTRDWPRLIPSIFRYEPDEKADAEKRLDEFLEWASHVPQMADYEGDPGVLTAIAQHYGIPTAYLDITTEPEVAVLFSKTVDDDSDGDAVIYCFRRSELVFISGARLKEINVQNLWRLERQRGLFLHYNDASVSTAALACATKIFFPQERLEPRDRERLYPPRRSALETILAQWFYRSEIIEGLSHIRATYSAATRRQTYPGAFRWRAVPELELDWVNGAVNWFYSVIENATVADAPIVFTVSDLDLLSFSTARDVARSCVTPGVDEYLRSKCLTAFEIRLSPIAESLANSVATILNRCWDGMRVLPFQRDDMIESLSTIAALIIARAEQIEGVDDWMDTALGETLTVDFAPIGGHIEAGSVSKARLLEAFSYTHVSTMTDFMQRAFGRDPLWLMDYIVEPWLLFDFKKFASLFISELVPSAIDAFWKEDLQSYKGALGCMWSTSFNPALLGYATLFSYRFQSPLALERRIEDVVLVLPGMSKSDIEELFISCMPRILLESKPFEVKFHGYSRDLRPLWRIPEVARRCKEIVALGGLCPLKVASEPKADPKEIADPGLGAFEIWLTSKGRMDHWNRRAMSPKSSIYDRFSQELDKSNEVLEALATSQPDWPLVRPKTGVNRSEILPTRAPLPPRSDPVRPEEF